MERIKKEYEKVKLKKSVYLFFSCLAIIIIAVGIAVNAVIDSSNQMFKSQQQRYLSYQLAQQFRQSSDDLTRMVRSYTVTGDVRFHGYFNHIIAIRNGEESRPDNYQSMFWDLITASHQYVESDNEKTSLIQLMHELNFSEKEFVLLSEAKSLSDTLIKMEVEAFNAMQGPHPELAQKIVYSPEYHQEKAKIMRKVGQFFSTLDLRTQADLDQIREKQQLVLNALTMMEALLVILFIVGVLFFKHAILQKVTELLAALVKIDKGDYDVSFTDDNDNYNELGELSQAITHLAVVSRQRDEQDLKIQQATEQLQFQKKALDYHAIVSITDPKANLLYINSKLEQVSGYSSEEVLGKNPRLFQSGYHDYAFYRNIWDTISNGEPWQGEIKNKAKNGSIYWASTTIIPQLDEQGKPEKYIALQTDISHVKEMEALAEQERANAEDANRAKSEFLANMSHELRTPLHGILSFAQFGIKKHARVSDEKLGMYFSSIKSSGDRLLVLLNDLLDLAKLEAGKMELTISKYDLRRTAKECVTEQSAKMDDKQLTLVWEGEQVDTLADYDASKIAQVVNNILSNAIKFTPEGRALNIIFSDSPYENVPAITLTLKDEGVGIPTGELDSVFDAFIQSSKTDTGAGGTGLGLAICKEIIGLHGGKIWAENNSKEGSSFSFVLPKNIKRMRNR